MAGSVSFYGYRWVNTEPLFEDWEGFVQNCADSLHGPLSNPWDDFSCDLECPSDYAREASSFADAHRERLSVFYRKKQERYESVTEGTAGEDRRFGDRFASFLCVDESFTLAEGRLPDAPGAWVERLDRASSRLGLDASSAQLGWWSVP